MHPLCFPRMLDKWSWGKTLFLTCPFWGRFWAVHKLHSHTQLPSVPFSVLALATPSLGALAFESLHSAWCTRQGLPLEAQPRPTLSLFASHGLWSSGPRRVVKTSIIFGPACPGGSCAWVSGYLSDSCIKHPQAFSYLVSLVMFFVCQSLKEQGW